MIGLSLPTPSDHLSAVKQLDDIINLSTNEDASLPVILRKLLVLSYQLKSERLTAWVNAELDGYASGGDLPDYRLIRAGARGNFSGPWQTAIKNMPLPSLVLDEKLRHWAEQVPVVQSIAMVEAAVE